MAKTIRESAIDLVNTLTSELLDVLDSPVQQQEKDGLVDLLEAQGVRDMHTLAFWMKNPRTATDAQITQLMLLSAVAAPITAYVTLKKITRGPYTVTRFRQLVDILHSEVDMLWKVDWVLETASGIVINDEADFFDYVKAEVRKSKNVVHLKAEYATYGFSSYTSVPKMKEIGKAHLNIELEDCYFVQRDELFTAPRGISDDLVLFLGQTYRARMTEAVYQFHELHQRVDLLEHEEGFGMERCSWEFIQRVLLDSIHVANALHPEQDHIVKLVPGLLVIGHVQAGPVDVAVVYRTNLLLLVVETQPNCMEEKIPQVMARMVAARESMVSRLTKARGERVDCKKRSAYLAHDLDDIPTLAMLTSGSEWIFLCYEPSKPAGEQLSRSQAFYIPEPIPSKTGDAEVQACIEKVVGLVAGVVLKQMAHLDGGIAKRAELGRLKLF